MNTASKCLAGGIAWMLLGSATPGAVLVTQTLPATLVTNVSARLNALVQTNGLPATNVFEWAEAAHGSVALAFDGVDDAVRITPAGALNAFPFTVTAWVKIPAGGGGGLFTKYDSEFGNGWRLNVGSTVSALYRRTTSNRLAEPLVGGNLDPGQWHHVAFAVDAIGGRIFVDGALVATNGWLGAAGAPTTGIPLEIGTAAGGFFHGEVDEVTLWNAALDANGIADLMLAAPGPSASLVGYWPFSEGTGTQAMDASGHGLGGTLTNGPVWEAAARPLFTNVTPAQVVTATNLFTPLSGLKAGTSYHFRSVVRSVAGMKSVGLNETLATLSPGRGTAVRFDGIDDYVTVPGIGDLLGGEVTIEFWMKANAMGAQGVFNLLERPPGTLGITAFGANLPQPDGGVAWSWGTTPTYAIRYVPPDPLVGTWQHFAFVASVSGSYMRIFRNGALEAQVARAQSATVAGRPLVLGRSVQGGTNSFDGELDEFRVWSKARLATEIQAGLSSRVVGNEPGLVACFRMDEGSGPLLLDATTNGRHGLLVNRPTRIASTLPAVVATTLAASAVGSGRATLNGIVQGEGGSETRFWFEYGTLGSFGPPTTIQTRPAGLLVEPASITISNLGGFAVYQFRLVAATADATNYGSTLNFTMLHPAALTAVQLDGVNDYVQVLPNAALALTTAVTLEAWIRPTGPGSDATAGGAIIGRQGEYLLSRFPNGSIRYALALTDPPWAAFLNTGYIAPVDQWTHLAFTYDSVATNISLYANGQLVYSRRGTGSIVDVSPNENELRIGGRQSGVQFFQGQIDEVRLWSIARSAVQIRDAYNRALSGAESGLVAYLRFNEGTGTSTADAGPNHFNAALLGGASWVPSQAGLFKPIVETLAPSPVLAAAATLRGHVNPSGLDTVAYFQFGKTEDYDRTNMVQSLGSGVGTLPFNAGLTNLEPGTTYHYRLVAYNEAGTNYGSDQAFTTLVLGCGWPISTKLAGGEANWPRHAVDAEGNTYLAGLFSGPASFNMPLVPQGGAATNAFIAKLARGGDWMWSSQIPVNAGGFTRIQAVAVDAARDIYVVGQFGGTNTFGTNRLIAPGTGTNLFVAKLDSTGTNWLWALATGGTGVDSANALALGQGTNVYVAGQFSGTANFGATNLVAGGPGDIFVACLDTNGSWRWAQRAGGAAANEAAQALAVDSAGSVYVAGQFEGMASFGTNVLAGAGGTDLFAAKLSPNGGWLLARRGGGSGADTATGLAVDAADRVFLVGQFTGTADYNSTLSGLNGGGGTNVFVLRLDEAAQAIWYAQGGPGFAASIAADAQDGVYITGDFTVTTQFGTNGLTASVSSDVFIARLSAGDGQWSWARRIGSTGRDTRGSVGVDAGGGIVVSGTYQNTVEIGYVLLNTPNSQDIFVARLEAARPDMEPAYEHNNYLVGQAIPVPALAQDQNGGAFGQPTITILAREDPGSDVVNSFRWSRPERKLFAVRRVTAIFKWPLTADASNTTSVAACVGRTFFPTHPQMHVAGAPVELEPAVGGFPLRVYELAFSTVPGATVDPGSQQFSAAQPGWSVIQFLDTGGEFPNAELHPSVFEVVRSVAWNDPAFLRDNQAATIGVELSLPAHSDPAGKSGYVFFERSHYDGVGEDRAHDRASRQGPILPVNKNKDTATNDDLVVVWYGTSPVTGVGWPDKPYRYAVSWPPDAEPLVLASGAGFGVSPAEFPSARVYSQPDTNRAGFNPNEEHAALYGSILYALRHDLNTLMKVSEPYVLLKYQQPAGGQWAMKVFKVVPTNGFSNFAYSGEAGQELALPPPLSLLPLCGASNQIVSGPGFQDYQGHLYARAAGTNLSGATIVARYCYPLQPGFYYDLDGNGQPEAPVGACVPWLDRWTNGVAGQGIDVVYNISWPVNAPSLQSGETLFGRRAGLPDIRGAGSAQVIFDQANPRDTNALASLVRLFDPLSERTLPLPENFVLPPDIVTANQAGRRAFTALPYALRSRLFYDDQTQRLSFGGLLNEDVRYGGPDNPLLLINVLSPRERERIKLLSSDGPFQQAINDLYDLTRNPNRIDADQDGQADQALRIGLAYHYQTNQTTGAIATNIVPETLGDIPKALVAGPGTASGFVTIAENSDPALGGLPVTLHVLRIAGGPWRGDVKVLYPDNVFDEKLTLRHSGDFGGEPQNFEFEWYYQPPGSAAIRPNLPTVRADGQIEDERGWIRYTAVPAGTNGFNDITLGEGTESRLLTLADNWFICRYRGPAAGGGAGVWSAWAGSAGGEAQFVEGWVKRVLFGLDPFNQRTTDFHANETVTFASMLQQAGPRYEGDVAFNTGDDANRIGLIEAYETVLRRARRLSIDAVPGVNYQPANEALLQVSGRIADFYMLLGNEAVADAADPTIGFRTDSAGYGTLAPSIFTFQNQLESLLEEEVVLLRGRDDRSATVRSAPVYNRLFWNFTHDEGEVAYVQAYNIADQNRDGFINANDARVLFPQGHGDAWGHFLTATKTYYALLQNTNFDWQPRSETIQLAGSPVEVDYLDERKFARAAAAKARTGAEIVDLTYRRNYVDDPNGQFQGYKDTDTTRAWGVSEWGHRAGTGALFDWVLANAVLPAVDSDPTHTGIARIDRTTVAEIAEILAGYENVQSQVDKADAGLNPLGLAKNVVPFDIDPTQIAAGKTHFEQIYDRALNAVNNTVTVFNHANQLSQALRGLQDTVNQFSQNVEQQERDLKNRLIEIFGYPYAGDIGAGRTFPAGYDGPDIYHYKYINTVELNGETLLSVSAEVTNVPAYYKPLLAKVPGLPTLGEFFADDLPGNTVTIVTQGVLTVNYPLSPGRYGFTAPADWGARRAPGELQQALSDLMQSQARLQQGVANYDALLRQIEDSAALLEARYNLRDDLIRIRNQSDSHVRTLRIAGAAFRLTGNILKSAQEQVKELAEVAKEALPKVVGPGGTDVTSGGRAIIKLGKFLGSTGLRIGINLSEGAQEAAKTAQEDVRRSETIQIEGAQFDYEVQQKLKELEQLIRQEPGLRLEGFALQEAVLQNTGRYLATLAKGLRVLDERIAFRKQTAAETQSRRYQDMTFRIFRNDAIQKYRAQFDLAAQYVFLAAVAYDFDTQLLGGRSGAGREFLTDIIRQRSLGQVENGVPIAGRHGLADPLARLNQNFSVLKGQLGFNNPQTETGRFSVRRERFRIGSGPDSDATWRDELKKAIVPNLWEVPEFRRYCRPFAPESAGPQPGLVLRFPTTVTFGLNYFGWRLGGGDNNYDPTLFATKVRSAGVWFTNYNEADLSLTPRVYLVPVGADVLRSPSGANLETREWRVVDQKIPVPFPIGFSSLNNRSWIPMNDSLSDTFAEIRRFSSFRAYPDNGSFNTAEATTDSRLIGRSVWNTDWMLIIPGGTLLFDPNQGLDAFINSVGDIRIFFQTYAYSGN